MKIMILTFITPLQHYLPNNLELIKKKLVQDEQFIVELIRKCSDTQVKIKDSIGPAWSDPGIKNRLQTNQLYKTWEKEL